MLVSPGQSAQARDAILGVRSWEVHADFLPYTTFAGGDEANNKLNADKPLGVDSPEVLEAVLEPMGALVMGGKGDKAPDTLWGVPSGGQDYAIELAQRLGLRVVQLKKVINKVGIKTFRPLTGYDTELLEEAERMVA